MTVTGASEGSPELVPCFACTGAGDERNASWLAGQRVPLPLVGDAEGPRLAASLPPVIDAHVHLFPDPVFEAIWRWFEKYGWAIRYKLRTPEVIEFMLARGVERIVALHYAHRPGMARFLNAYVADVVAREPRVTGLATVLPGEPDARGILDEAFAAGLAGVKLHCHVQCFAPDAPELEEVYEACEAAGKPVVIHAGREPASPEYKCDPYALCGADRIERVLRAHPKLRVCVPHLGADEWAGYTRLVERFDNLWLDTTMIAADLFPARREDWLGAVRARPDRVLYGTDFPNLPYAWDREITRLAKIGLREEHLAALLAGNARELFGLGPPA